MTGIIILAGVSLAVGLALLPRRISVQASSLGSMSATWLAEERASER